MVYKLRKSRKDETEVWLRYKVIYERHQAGESYSKIARDLGISAANVKHLAGRWKMALELHSNILQNREGYMTTKRGQEWTAKMERLAGAGLFSGDKRLPEYGYA